MLHTIGNCFASSLIILTISFLKSKYLFCIVLAVQCKKLINLTFIVKIYIFLNTDHEWWRSKKATRNMTSIIFSFFLCKVLKSVFIYYKKYEIIIYFYSISLFFIFWWCDVPLSSLLSFQNIIYTFLLSFTLYEIVVTRESNEGEVSFFFCFIKICCNDFHKLKYLRYV